MLHYIDDLMGIILQSFCKTGVFIVVKKYFKLAPYMNLSHINESNGKERFLNLLLDFLEGIGIIEVEKEELKSN